MDTGKFQLDRRIAGATGPRRSVYDLSRLGNQRGGSQSGHERNHLFLNSRGEQFTDVSGISGLDSPADGRAFVIWDYNRDGWLDLSVVSANMPLLQHYRNRTRRHGAEGGRMIALRFVGGNKSDKGTNSWSARDGYGTRVRCNMADLTIEREHRCGEGLAAQNSATMVIGIGRHREVESLGVHWPSGKVQEHPKVKAGTLVTVYENPAMSPDGSGFALGPYKVAAMEPGPAGDLEPRKRLSLIAEDDAEGSRLLMFSTMAAWCVACRIELGELAHLRSEFAAEELGMFGVPWDDKEEANTLSLWVAANRPPYRLLSNLTDRQRLQVKAHVLEALKVNGLPVTIVTDAKGQVLLTRWGPPTVSQIRKLLGTVGK